MHKFELSKCATFVMYRASVYVHKFTLAEQH